MQTTVRCFKDVVGNDGHVGSEGHLIDSDNAVGRKVPKLIVTPCPHLQNFDKGPNGRGLQLEAWLGKFGKHGTPKFAGKFDESVMKTEPSWTDKSSGKWSPEQMGWRIEWFKTRLSQIVVGSEVVVVTHGSFLIEIIGTCEYSLDPSSFDRLHEVSEASLTLSIV